MIGNANTLMMQGTAGGLSASQNPNLMTTDSLKANKDLNNSDWLSGWNNSIRDVIITNSIQNASVSLLKLDDTRINCFITRDISFQWQCSKNGLIFGGAIIISIIRALVFMFFYSTINLVVVLSVFRIYTPLLMLYRFILFELINGFSIVCFKINSKSKEASKATKFKRCKKA